MVLHFKGKGKYMNRRELLPTQSLASPRLLPAPDKLTLSCNIKSLYVKTATDPQSLISCKGGGGATRTRYMRTGREPESESVQSVQTPFYVDRTEGEKLKTEAW